MKKKDIQTKVLAIAGTILVCLPILVPLVFSVIRILAGKTFLFKYLMPAELFPVALVSGILLLWAALRARSRWEMPAEVLQNLVPVVWKGKWESMTPFLGEEVKHE